MIAGATLYGISKQPLSITRFLFKKSLIYLWRIANASEEFLVRQRPLYEVVGQLGMWGFLINGVQSSALEWRGMKEVPWTGATSKFILLRYSFLYSLMRTFPSRSLDGIHFW